MGYNWFMIASDTLFDSRDGFFGVTLSDEDIVEIECLSVIAMAVLSSVQRLHAGAISVAAGHRQLAL